MRVLRAAPLLLAVSVMKRGGKDVAWGEDQRSTTKMWRWMEDGSKIIELMAVVPWRDSNFLAVLIAAPLLLAVAIRKRGGSDVAWGD